MSRLQQGPIQEVQMVSDAETLNNLRHHLAIMHEQNRLALETAEYIASKSQIVQARQELIQAALAKKKLQVEAESVRQIAELLNERNAAMGNLIRASDALQEEIAAMNSMIEREIESYRYTMAAERDRLRYLRALDRLGRQAIGRVGGGQEGEPGEASDTSAVAGRPE